MVSSHFPVNSVLYAVSLVEMKKQLLSPFTEGAPKGCAKRMSSSFFPGQMQDLGTRVMAGSGYMNSPISLPLKKRILCLFNTPNDKVNDSFAYVSGISISFLTK